MKISREGVLLTIVAIFIALFFWGMEKRNAACSKCENLTQESLELYYEMKSQIAISEKLHDEIKLEERDVELLDEILIVKKGELNAVRLDINRKWNEIKELKNEGAAFDVKIQDLYEFIEQESSKVNEFGYED